jgi:hypothetical protein
LTIKLTPHTFTQEVFSGSLFSSPTPFEVSSNLCCYPSDIQLSKNKLL